MLAKKSMSLANFCSAVSLFTSKIIDGGMMVVSTTLPLFFATAFIRLSFLKTSAS